MDGAKKRRIDYALTKRMGNVSLDTLSIQHTNALATRLDLRTQALTTPELPWIAAWIHEFFRKYCDYLPDPDLSSYTCVG